MRISVIGTGYVGLVSGTCFAELGIHATCVDRDISKIERLKNGEIPIYEPGLDTLVAKNVQEGLLHFTTDIATAIKGTDAVFIAVGTPPLADSDGADLSQIFQVAKDIAACMDDTFKVIVTKSTVPVGTARKVTEAILAVNPNASFEVVSNPEFLREGSAIKDFMNPDRVVIGARTQPAIDIMQSLYSTFSKRGVPIVVTTQETSELIKYAANAFLATKITFINEIARLCEKTGANVEDVARGIGLDNRIGPKFLKVGPGIGGSCFPKDTKALAETGREYNSPITVVESVVSANQSTQEQLVMRIINACGGNVAGKKIGVLGLAFKANTDDMRDAPALTILSLLHKAGAEITAFDPVAMENAQKMMPYITCANDMYSVAQGADTVLVLTEWDAFHKIDMQHLARQMKTPCMVDLRNLYELEDMAKTPFHYVSLGREDVVAESVAVKQAA